MAYSPRRLSLPIYVLVLNIVGIYLFKNGFLLTKLALDYKSACVHSIPEIPSPQLQVCPKPPSKHRKVIFFIIDALRFDFSIHHNYSNAETVPAYHNKLPVLSRLYNSEPKNTFHFRFIADPPTTTLQRLKALTTGTLPTFIDMSSNFASESLTEDSLLYQLNRHNKRVTFLGDDTWIRLFPHSFSSNGSYPFPSFNVWDLHTVDNGVLSHLYQIIPTNSWDLLIAHFLGVDHVGHRHGPAHHAMDDKLSQMDGEIEKVIKAMDEDTILMVMGDHGMDGGGDHGGDGSLEVQSALWIYSKTPFTSLDRMNPRSRSIYDFFKNLETAQDFPRPISNNQAIYRTISQIDLVPTFAYLLGIPIPFESLGSIIPELFLPSFNSLDVLLQYTRSNALQIYNYLKAYSSEPSSDFSAITLDKLFHSYDLAEQRYNSLVSKNSSNVSNGPNLTYANFKEVYVAYHSFMTQTLQECRSVWARFSVLYMICGIIVLTISVLTIVIDRQFAWILHTRNLFLGGLGGGVLGLILSTINVNELIKLSKTDFILFLSAVCSLYGFRPVSKQFSLFHKIQFLSFDTFTLFLCHIPVFLYGANSFVVFEQEVMHYFLQSHVYILLLHTFRSSQKKLYSLFRVLLASALFRITDTITVCREETLPDCQPTFYGIGATGTTITRNELVYLSITCLLFIVFQSELGLFGRFTYIKESTANRLWNLSIKLLGFSVSLHWYLEEIVHGKSEPVFGIYDKDRTISVWNARFSMLLIIISFVSWYSSRRSSDATQTFQSRSELQRLATTALLSISLFQKPSAIIALTLTHVAILTLSKAVPPSHLGPLLSVLPKHLFFVTGHQATFSSIMWSLGFTGLHEMNYYLSAGFVSLNFVGGIIYAVVWGFILGELEMESTSDQQRINTKISDGIAENATNSKIPQTLTYLLYFTALDGLTNTVIVSIMRRHFRVWKVFAPRWMLSGLMLVVVNVTVVLAMTFIGGKHRRH
ncbi:hypothetical protein BKA69DRAFT_1125277 [Paraphysoderma sedebokerense]|nr:hypothetical protein BKA69DRAFT_1125277 [Paraphysoderma sedebokerense]